MQRAGKIYLLMAALLLLTLVCYVFKLPGAGWISTVCVANLPVLIVLASLPDRARRRGLLVLAGLSVMLTAGLSLLVIGPPASAIGTFPTALIVMLLCLWLIPWVWVTWGFVWMFESFWPDAETIERLKGIDGRGSEPNSEIDDRGCS